APVAQVLEEEDVPLLDAGALGPVLGEADAQGRCSDLLDLAALDGHQAVITGGQKYIPARRLRNPDGARPCRKRVPRAALLALLLVGLAPLAAPQAPA